MIPGIDAGNSRFKYAVADEAGNLYIEGLRPSIDAECIQITVEVDPDGDGPIGFVVCDDVRVSVSRRLQVPYYNQDGANWCWATSLSMILRYYGYERKPWEIAADFNKGPNDGLGIFDRLAFGNYLEEHYDGGSRDAWTAQTFWNNDSLVARMQEILGSGHPIWMGCWDARHAIVATGFDGTSDYNHVYIHDPSGALTGGTPYIHRKYTWSDFKELIDTTWFSLFGDVLMFYAKTSALSEMASHASVQVLPIKALGYSGLSFSNSVGGTVRSLNLRWDGREPYAGYYYEPDGVGWYPEDTDGMYDDYGYNATQADTLMLSPSYSNYLLPQNNYYLRIYAEVRDAGTGLLVHDATSAINVVGPLSWKQDPFLLHPGISFPLAGLPLSVYQLLVKLQGNTDGSGVYETLDECRFYFGVATPSTFSTLFTHSLVDNSDDVGSPSVESANANGMTPASAETMFATGSQRWHDAGLSPETNAALEKVRLEVADLDGGTIGLTTADGIILDADAAGYGWFVDETPWDDEEFTNVVYDWELHADVDSPAAVKIDLLTVLMHEMGHLLGLADVPAGIDPTRLMTGILPAGVRRLPSQFDLLHQPEHQETTEVEASPEYRATPSDDSLAPIYESTTAGNSAVVAQHEDTYSPEDLRFGFTNGMFAISDESDPGFGWTVHGPASLENGWAVLGEGGSYFAGSSQTFIVPEGAQTLLFTIVSAGLGDSEGHPPDAFEVALLNADTMTSLAGTADGLNNTDAFLNIQASGQTYFGSQVLVPDLSASGEVLVITEPIMIEIDLAGVPAGTMATLYFDLLGFGEDDSQVVIDNVLIIGEGPIPPIASDDSAETGIGQPVEIDVLVNDFDLDGEIDLTTVQLVPDSGPEHGSVDVDPVTGIITYQPTAGYEGPDSFRYTVCDNEGYESNAAYVVVTVALLNQPPTAMDDTYTVDEDNTLIVEVTEGVLDNDSDPDGDSLSATLITNVGHGTLTFNSDGSFEYTPEANFNSSDSFTYVANDGTFHSDEATVSITITAVNDAPEALPASLITDEDTPVSIDLRLLISDVETAIENMTFIMTNPMAGTVELLADGHTAVFSPEANYSGAAAFDYSVTDTGDNGAASITTGPETIDITVIAVADIPILTAQDATGNEGLPIPLDISAALADLDSSETLSITIAGVPANSPLSTGTDDGGGNWSLTPEELIGLTITVPDETSFDLDITATATEISNGNNASSSTPIHVTVLNVPPYLSISGPDHVDEGSVYTLNLDCSDPGDDTVTSWTINWGNGIVETVSGNPTSVSHIYADGPDECTISAEAMDEDGTHSCPNTVEMTVNNVAPTVDAGSDQTVNEGQIVSLDPATFNDLGTADTHTATIDWGDGTGPEPGIVTEFPFGPPGSTLGADGTVSGSHVYADNGTYIVTVTVTDDDSGIGSDTLTVTVNNVAPTVDVDPQTQTVQYSDSITPVAIAVNDVGWADTLSVTTSWSNDGINFTPGLPDVGTINGGIVLSGPTTGTGSVDLDLSGVADLAPGEYMIRITAEDDDSASTGQDLTIVVTREDAEVTYTGVLNASTITPAEDDALIFLAATIQDIVDPETGDVTNARIRFINRDTSTYISPELTPVLVDPVDKTVATVSYLTTLSIPKNSTGEPFTIGVVVNGVDLGPPINGDSNFSDNGFYQRSSTEDDVVVNVYRNEGEFITGGGYVIIENPMGDYAANLGSRMNFGFNVKFNKKGTNLRGKVNVIFRRTESDGLLHVYQIKSNAIDSLGVPPDNDPDTGIATFTSKANLQDVTDPLNPVSLGGNLSFQMMLTDMGEPGSSDSIAITVYASSGELLFSSEWDGVQTVEKLLCGGNVVVHDADALKVSGGGPLPGQNTVSHLSQSDLEASIPTAVELWRDAGVDQSILSNLRGIEYRVEDLVDAYLGLAYPSTGLVLIDDTAAGYGWYNIDVVSVLAHELGHMLDFDHDDPYDIMAPFLVADAGGTRTPVSFGRQPSGFCVAHAVDQKAMPQVLRWGGLYERDTGDVAVLDFANIGHVQSYGFNTTNDGITYSTYNVLGMLRLQEADDLVLSTCLEADDNAPIIDIFFSTNVFLNIGLLDDENDFGPIDTAQEMLLRTLANEICTARNCKLALKKNSCTNLMRFVPLS